MATKPNADYKRTERERKYAAGLVPLQVWVHSLDVERVKGYAARVAKLRAKGQAK